MSQALRAAAGGQKDPNIVIDADAKATHQSVINLMEAARLAGYGRIIFTTSRK
jgi:biopolymer transport protein ExbD